jgi:hypothetical protein
MRYWTLVAMTAALVFALVPTARADVRYVAAGGADDSECTEDVPCALSVAPSKVEDGDEVRLLSSSYTGNGDVAFTKRVSIVGLMGHRPTLEVGSLQLLAPGSRLEDVTVVGHLSVALIAVGSTLERVEATHQEGTNTVCELDGDTTMSNSACWASPTAAEVANAVGINLWSVTPAADGHVTLRNVTAHSSADAITGYGGSAAISSSILAGGIHTFGAATLAADHSATSLPGAGNVNVPTDSIFPQLLIGGIHPAAGSPTIDAGVAASAFDLDGNPRSLGSASDMGAYEWVPTAPQVATGDVSAVSATAAVVPGSVDARGAATTFSVEYGVSGYAASVAGGSAGSATLPVGVAATLSGLAPSTTYHYRVVATNSKGTTAGEDRAFTTAALPAAPTPTPTPAVTPPAAKPKVTVTLASNKKCLRSRSTSLRVKIATGGTITGIDVYVNKKRIKRVTKAADLKKTIKVSKLPKGAYTLEVRVKTKDGRTVKSSKKYRTCSSSR